MTVTAIPTYSLAGGALIASPSSTLREQVVQRLNGRCRPVQQALGGADALVKLEMGNWQILFLDRRLPDLDAEDVISIIQQRFPGIQVVLLDSDNPQLSDSEARNEIAAVPPQNAGQEAASESRARRAIEPLPGMIGSSDAMQRMYRMVKLVAPRTTTVLITGPTGSGKEVVARALHLLSPR